MTKPENTKARRKNQSWGWRVQRWRRGLGGGRRVEKGRLGFWQQDECLCRHTNHKYASKSDKMHPTICSTLQWPSPPKTNCSHRWVCAIYKSAEWGNEGNGVKREKERHKTNNKKLPQWRCGLALMHGMNKHNRIGWRMSKYFSTVNNVYN